MRFGLLGSLLVERDGAVLPLTSPKGRTLLAALLLEPNKPVPVASLQSALWGRTPPATASASLQNHVARLRRQLGPEGAERLRGTPSGYLFRVERHELDVALFQEGAEAARTGRLASDWETVSARTGDALALWRGTPLGDLPLFDQASAWTERLVAERLQLLEWRFEAELELGRHSGLAAEIAACAAEDPLREEFQRQLMLALHRDNRRAEALEVYQRLRRRLVEELGVDPAPRVQQVHLEILAEAPPQAPQPPHPPQAPQPPTAPARSTPPATARPADRAPAQLPSDTRLFTGREAELEKLLALADRAPEGSEAGMVVISAIEGMAGVGKTTLAVRAAHRVRSAFPDGQLFVDLHGHTPGRTPLSSGDGLDRVLRSLGVPTQLIPRDLDERSAFFRDRLAGTRTLLVLDDAASAAQVRPLLPGTPGCLVLVTSRSYLPGLDDAHSLSLGVLGEAESLALLRRAAGTDRVDPEHPLAVELVRLCGHLPLAVRIVAARLRHNRSLTLDQLVRGLRDERERLGSLRDEDRGLTAVFESSYQSLPGAEQLLFRRLGRLPGPDADAFAAAALLDGLWWRAAVVVFCGLGLITGTGSLVYFTIQSNVIVFGYFVGSVYWMVRRGTVDAPAPRLRGAATLYILITGLVAHFVLNHGADPLPGLGHGPDRLANWSSFFLHYVTPVMVILDWLCLKPRNASQWRDLPVWLSFPLSYAGLTLLRAALFPAFPNRYPYFFLDPTAKGYGWVGLQVAQLTVGFVLLAVLVVGLDRLGTAAALPTGLLRRRTGTAPGR